MAKKVAVVLFNLGGPDSPEAIKPFLFNLFYDPAIIRVPKPFRWLLAKLISTKRTPEATHIYSNIGGKSPILPNTQAQQQALNAQLTKLFPDYEFSTTIAMRYWHPFTEQAVAEVKSFNPDQVLLLPLYPQFSTATSGSSIAAWYQAAAKQQLDVPTKAACCYPYDEGYVSAYAKLIKAALKKTKVEQARVLFSAHGLPESIVKKGDPYQWQVEQTVKQIVLKLGIEALDFGICYQSRVGPQKWIGPSTDDEIERAAKDGRDIVLVPVAFVSEHSETLVELDIEYQELATEKGVKNYIRVPTVDAHPDFIAGLANICGKLLHDDAENFPQCRIARITAVTAIVAKC